MMAKDPVIAGWRISFYIFALFHDYLEIEHRLYHWDLFSKLVFKMRYKDTSQLKRIGSQILLLLLKLSML